MPQRLENGPKGCRHRSFPFASYQSYLKRRRHGKSLMEAYEAGEALRIGRRGHQCDGQSCEAGLWQPNCTCPIIFPYARKCPTG
jgi:hypothetical protein